MKVGIMQPYFFPYLGHFALISLVDEWVVFDVSQYTPKTWMNRNRVLHPNQGWQYLTVPLSNSSTSIKTAEAKLVNLVEAKRLILGKLAHYKKKAPYFYVVNNLVEEAFDLSIDNSLVNLNVNALKVVCEYIGIPFLYQIASAMELDYPPNLGPGGWAPFISKELNANEYVNPVAGRALFQQEDFVNNGVKLSFAQFSEFRYQTAPYEFQSSLSVIDVMMWNSPKEILNAINQNKSLIQ